MRRRVRPPRVRKGQAVTARVWNDLAESVDEALHGPRDVTPGAPFGSDVYLVRVTEEDTTAVRVTNPEDEDQYVDLDRTIAWTAQFGRGFALAVRQGLPVKFATYKS